MAVVNKAHLLLEQYYVWLLTREYWPAWMVVQHQMLACKHYDFCGVLNYTHENNYNVLHPIIV